MLDPPPPYQKDAPNGEVALASQAVKLEQTLESNLPHYSAITTFKTFWNPWYCFRSLMSLVVFTIYLLVVIGCSVHGLKSLYLVHFDNVGGRILVRDDTYAATAMPLKRDVTSATESSAIAFREVSSEVLSSAFAAGTGISESGNLVATAPTPTTSATFSTTTSATLTGSKSFRSVTATWKIYGTASVPSATSSYHTVPEALYLPTPLGSYTSYMGYYGTIEDGHYRHSWAMGIPDDYYVSIWSYGYYSSGYKTKRNSINSGIDYSKMVNSNSRAWIYMPGLNYKETEIGFSKKSKLNHTNNVAKALQPLSVILMVSLVLFVGMVFQILPRKWTPYVASLTVVYSFVFNILYSVVAKNYATYISTAFSLQEITVKKGSQSVTLIWVAFAFQCIFCFVELILYLK